MLRIYAFSSTAIAAIALLGATQAIRQATFDSITVHRINVMDREGKLAMVIASHDDEAAPVIQGYSGGHREQGNNADNGIIFFNQLGDEQGGLVWNSTADRAHSGDSLSFDTANTDQLIHVEDGDDNGHHYAGVIGWDRVANEEEMLVPLMRALDAARTPAQRDAVMAQLRARPGAPARFFVGYDRDDVSQLTLSDGRGRPRLRLLVTAAGDAKIEFLDAAGNVTSEYPHT